jgi:8-oxo-dGTP pyrophosphatase MutT (NUDIX family)
MTAAAADPPEVHVRPGATVLLVRDGSTGDRPLEVLLLRRHPSTAFGGVWAFPGGVVETTDALCATDALDEVTACARLGVRSGGGAFWAAAARETIEETGLPVAVDDLRYLSHWITPEGAPKRYDTRFFVARAPEGDHAHDEREHTDSRWIRPTDAIDLHLAGELDLILPTLRNLEAIGRFATVAELLEAASVEGDPRAVDDGGGWRILLPGDPGHPGRPAEVGA